MLLVDDIRERCLGVSGVLLMESLGVEGFVVQLLFSICVDATEGWGRWMCSFASLLSLKDISRRCSLMMISSPSNAPSSIFNSSSSITTPHSPHSWVQSSLLLSY